MRICRACCGLTGSILINSLTPIIAGRDFCLFFFLILLLFMCDFLFVCVDYSIFIDIFSVHKTVPGHNWHSVNIC